MTCLHKKQPHNNNYGKTAWIHINFRLRITLEVWNSLNIYAVFTPYCTSVDCLAYTVFNTSLFTSFLFLHSFHEPHPHLGLLPSHYPTHVGFTLSSPPFSSSITSLFHSRLETHLFL